MNFAADITERALACTWGLSTQALASLRNRYLSKEAKHWYSERGEVIIHPSGQTLLWEKIGPTLPKPPAEGQKKEEGGPVTLRIVRRLRNPRFVLATDSAKKEVRVKVVNNLDWQAGDTLQALETTTAGLFNHSGPRPRRPIRKPYFTPSKKEGGAA